MTRVSLACSGVDDGGLVTAGEARTMKFAVYRTPWIFNLRHGGGGVVCPQVQGGG